MHTRTCGNMHNYEQMSLHTCVAQLRQKIEMPP